MAEVAAVISLVASIGSLVDLSARFVSRLNEFGAHTTDLPKSFSSLADRLPLLTRSLQSIKSRAQAGCVSDDEVKELARIVDSILDQTKIIQQCLDQITPASGASRLARLRAALKSLAKDGKIKRALEKIHHGIEVLILHQAAASMAASDRILQELVHLKVEQTMQGLFRDSASQSSSEHIITRQVIQSVSDRISQEISDSIKNNLEAVRLQVSEMTHHLTLLVSSDGRSLMPSKNNVEIVHGETTEVDEVISSAALMKSTSRHPTRFVRNVDMFGWFGKVFISVQDIHIRGELTHVLTDILMIPSSWLFSMQCAVRVRHFRSVIARESPKLLLRPVQVVAKDSPIVTSIRSRDADGAMQLLRQNKVHPFAVTASGVNLLQLVVTEIGRLSMTLVIELCIREFSPDDELCQRQLPYSAERINEEIVLFGALRELYLHLLAQGIDPTQSFSKERSVIGAFLEFFGAGMQNLPSLEIPELFMQTMSNTEGTICRVEDGFAVGELLRNYCSARSSLPYGSFINKLLNDDGWAFCTDKGIGPANAQALVSMLIFHSDDIEYYKRYFERWNPHKQEILDSPQKFFPRRFKVVRSLTTNIKEDIKYSHSQKEPVYPLRPIKLNFEAALRLSLIYASRLKGLCGIKEDVSYVRRSVVKEVLLMLQADVVVLHDIEDSLLDWCNEWEILDVWIEALKRFGSPIPEKTRKAWKEQKKYYKYEDLLEDCND